MILKKIIRDAPDSVQARLAEDELKALEMSSQPEELVEKYRETLNILRQFATAIATYQIGENTLPGSLASLVPDYLPRLQDTDAWGNKLIYKVDAQRQTYWLASAGSDGRFDGFEQKDDAAAQVKKRVSITTASLPAVAAGANYNAVLTARDGRPPYRWSLSGGKLPPGLNLAADGAIRGTPTTQGNFTFTARVQDAGRPVQSATRALSLRINPPPDGTARITYKKIVWLARLQRARLEVQGAGQGSWGRSWKHVDSNVYDFQGVGTDQGPVLIYASGNRWHITQLHWASGAPQNRRSFGERIFVTKGGQYGVPIKVGQTCYDYSWNALKQIDCRTGR